MREINHLTDKLQNLIGDTYTDFQVIGEGGLSYIFRATHIRLNKYVAIKVTKTSRIAHKLYHEYNVLKNLSHDYLLDIYNCFQDDDGNCYIIMEYVVGTNLREYVQNGGALNWCKSVELIYFLCQAVQYLHEHCIIHADIKPENIMVMPDGKIKLIDYDLSININESPSSPLGFSKYYSAPEVYNVSKQVLSGMRHETIIQSSYTAFEDARTYGTITVRSDIYSIGAVWYFIITGYSPSIWNKKIVSLSSYQYECNPPSRLRHIIERCIARNPNDRFPNVKEIKMELELYYYSNHRVLEVGSVATPVIGMLISGVNGLVPYAYSFYRMLRNRIARQTQHYRPSSSSTRNDDTASALYDTSHKPIPIMSGHKLRTYVNDEIATQCLIDEISEKAKSERKSIFISYAHEDRAKVISAIQGMMSVCPELDIFFDLDSIRSGEYWENRLEKEIRRCDKLYLFWSRSASQSDWVEREWKYMLSVKGLDYIYPIQIENPNVCPPPPRELRKIQFRNRETFYYPLA